MPFVVKKMEQDHAFVYRSILEILTPYANLSVLQIRIALETKHALIINVKILAQEFVELMQNVEYQTMLQHVSVSKDIAVTPQQHVIKYKSVRIFLNNR